MSDVYPIADAALKRTTNTITKAIGEINRGMLEVKRVVEFEQHQKDWSKCSTCEETDTQVIAPMWLHEVCKEFRKHLLDSDPDRVFWLANEGPRKVLCANCYIKEACE